MAALGRVCYATRETTQGGREREKRKSQSVVQTREGYMTGALRPLISVHNIANLCVLGPTHEEFEQTLLANFLSLPLL